MNEPITILPQPNLGALISCGLISRSPERTQYAAKAGNTTNPVMFQRLIARFPVVQTWEMYGSRRRDASVRTQPTKRTIAPDNCFVRRLMSIFYLRIERRLIVAKSKGNYVQLSGWRKIPISLTAEP